MGWKCREGVGTVSDYSERVWAVSSKSLGLGRTTFRCLHGYRPPSGLWCAFNTGNRVGNASTGHWVPCLWGTPVSGHHWSQTGKLLTSFFDKENGSACVSLQQRSQYNPDSDSPQCNSGGFMHRMREAANSHTCVLTVGVGQQEMSRAGECCAGKVSGKSL